MRLPHVASLSVTNRHISPITILNNEIYKYVASNLDFSENTKEVTAELGTGIKDVEEKLEKVLETYWWDPYVRYVIYGAMIAVFMILLTIVIKVSKCLN